MYGDSSDEDDRKVEEPLPEFEIRATDMREALQHKWVRSKYYLFQQYHKLSLCKLFNHCCLNIVCAKAVEDFKLDKEIATCISKAINQDADLLDEGAGWHVIVGKSYASAITCQTKHFIFFDLKECHKSFLLFKTQ